MTKVLVLYYSSYGHIEKMAQAAAEGARARRLALTASVVCLVPAALIAVFPGWFIERL